MKITEALESIKQNSKEKFDSTIEIHINFSSDAAGQVKNLRYTTSLPFGSGKKQKIATLASKKIKGADLELSEDDIKKIGSGELKPKADFDIVVSEPKFMSKLAKVAKILGPAGAMPNPKLGTVTEDVEKAVAELIKGKVEIKTEKEAPIVHTTIGKLSLSTKDLQKNFEALMGSIQNNKPAKTKQNWIRSVYITSSMGKSVKVDL